MGSAWAEAQRRRAEQRRRRDRSLARHGVALLYGWERILRDPIRERTWFLPVTVLLSAVALSVVTRITTTLITGKPPGQLAREERRRKR